MFNCPLSSEKADRLIDVLALPPDARVVDIGCGTGELLVRIIEKYRAHGTGIDPNRGALDDCRRRAEGRVPPDLLDLRPVEAAAFEWPDRPFDAAVCIGSTHAFGGFAGTLRELNRRVAPRGVILIGDLFWQRPPEPAYRKVIGDDWPPGDTDNLARVRVGEAEGLALIYAARSSPDEWDHFEGRFAAAGYRRALAGPPGPARDAAVERVRRWHHAYLQWGRDTLGFGFYAFMTSPLDGAATLSP